MKRILLFVCLNLVIIASSALANNPPASAEQLRSQLESAIKAKDRKAIEALSNERGVSDEMKSLDGMLFDDLVKPDASIKSVALLPLPKDFQLTNEVGGVRYIPNVSVVGLINVEFKEEGNSLQMSYGQKDGTFYIAGMVAEKSGLPAVKEKDINVIVMGLSAPEPVSFAGKCIYLKNGKEMTEDINGDKGNLSKSFWGDHVKSCTVKRTSAGGWFKLIITEDNKTIFESQRITNQEPVVYEKK